MIAVDFRSEMQFLLVFLRRLDRILGLVLFGMTGW